jgi:pyridoxine 5-phosphate synthase
MPKLSVNVDHVATLREARGAGYPSPVEAAEIAESTGAHGITVHLRGDRRHIQDADVAQLRRSTRGKLNLEMAVTEEMISIALDLRPDQVTLVPERADEVTTEGGLDLSAHGEAIAAAAVRLAGNGIAVSAFLDPEPSQIWRLAAIENRPIPGFEINTDSYSQASGQATERELDRIVESCRVGAELGLHVYAGHGLTTQNVGALSALKEIEEFNIGHAIVSRAVLVGMNEAVREMLDAIARGRGRSYTEGPLSSE